MVNIHDYKLHSKVTTDMLKEKNFKYIDGCYSYRFPVYKDKHESIMWCVLYVEIENKLCSINVYDQNNNTYASFFNRDYGGTNKLVEDIDRRINAQLDTFVKWNILKRHGKKRGKK